jgi:hypothetical protein
MHFLRFEQLLHRLGILSDHHVRGCGAEKDADLQSTTKVKPLVPPPVSLAFSLHDLAHERPIPNGQSLRSPPTPPLQLAGKHQVAAKSDSRR